MDGDGEVDDDGHAASARQMFDSGEDTASPEARRGEVGEGDEAKLAAVFDLIGGGSRRRHRQREAELGFQAKGKTRK